MAASAASLSWRKGTIFATSGASGGKKTWKNVEKCGKTWKNMEKHGKIWKTSGKRLENMWIFFPHLPGEGC